ncbi:glycosyltransferase [Corynebacterium sp. HMSC074H12]|uniref:glycosyltransferase n=1 Tax=Corynebacterium sp. HMSC074H12 TaxID=1739436 RepID=UPI0008D839E5|nr:glycosyltransferase [Corynebacterium sp. HMSC074H12]OFQ54744.1 hypothetical protein HMPREF2932_12455 [Corynebacterium sp. HMSC074H12]
MNNFLPGVSVVIPSFVADAAEMTGDIAATNLGSALASLAEQSLRKDLIEVLVILNGAGVSVADREARQIALRDSLASRFPKLNIRVLRSLAPGAGRARNLGIASASRRFVTFLDDDDIVQPNYLETGLENANDGAITLLPIVDITDGASIQDNSLNARIATLRGTTVPVATAPWALGFNASKIIPTALAQRYRYDESLRSGEDVVYFANFLRCPGLLLHTPQAGQEASYVRTIRPDSVSRQRESFDFNVAQRLECISKLREIEEADTKSRALEKLEQAQFGFVENYLKTHPGEVQKAINTAVDARVPGLNWENLRQERASRLVFSYCFPPYADTSANVTAKVIRNDAELVDVFYANMQRVRGRDDSTRLIVDPYLIHAEEIDVVPSFAHWGAICSYARQASRKASKRARKQGGYESMYSRALWSGSHVAAALFKDKHPGTRWEAEFSDPLSVGVDGTPRPGELTRGITTHQLRKMVERSDWSGLAYRTHFELTELVTLLYTDEVIFTNANQQQVMLERYPEELQSFVREKSTIRHHAVPTAEMYHLVESDYALDSDCINIAYFGNFYANRGIGDVLTALAKHPQREKFVLHIFTSNPEKLRRQLWGSPAADNVRINGYVPYLEFLNVSTNFDALVVNDTDTVGTAFSVNPFLPSKYADYVGSGTVVWGIVVEDSPLSNLPLTYRTASGDSAQAGKVLDELLGKSE